MDTSNDSIADRPPASRHEKFKDVVLVIPANKEELVIGSLVLKARQLLDRIIVVDNGSMDRTSEVAAYAEAKVIRLEKNMGKAHALLVGLNHARELGCKVAVTLDGDGQHKTREIPDVIKPVLEGKADLVIGSRFLSEGTKVPAYRRMGQKTLDVFTQIGSGHACTDTQSGFRAFSRKALDNLDISSSGYSIESDMIAHFAERGLVIVEVPITVRYEVPNKHKMNPLSHGISVLAGIVTLISYRRPLIAFGIPGFILMVAGMTVELWVFAEWVSADVFHYALSIGSAFVLVLGMLLLIAGLILNTLVIIMREK